jgi:hypothetical protein
MQPALTLMTVFQIGLSDNAKRYEPLRSSTEGMEIICDIAPAHTNICSWDPAVQVEP